MGSKIFNDLIHGHMDFHPLIISIIDTPQFQRLRHLKQTGPCYFVYPAAVHTRFEHSLGTSFLAGKLMEALNKKRGLFDEERRRETLSVQIAGLCHDLGHGPFSHSWEKFMRRCNIKWKHEESSVEIFDQILEENVIHKSTDGVIEEMPLRNLFRRYNMEEYIDKIKNMIKGDESKEDKKKYLYQIVSNARNGVDVDKWDYLMRDSKMVNVPINFDYNRILHFCRILENDDGVEEICFRDKESSMLMNMFLSRGMLHDKVYQHRKVKIIEEMLIDAFFFAKDRLNLTSTKLDTFLRLTDHIYHKILYEDFGDDKNMLEARRILERLQRRNLYICIATVEVKKKTTKKHHIKEIEDKVYELLKNEDDALDRKLIKALSVSIDMTKYNRDKSLRKVMIYTKQDNSDGVCQPKDFEWDKLIGLKPELQNINCAELLIIYKGDNRSKYREHCCNSLLSKILDDSRFISPTTIV